MKGRGVLGERLELPYVVPTMAVSDCGAQVLEARVEAGRRAVGGQRKFVIKKTHTIRSREIVWSRLTGLTGARAVVRVRVAEPPYSISHTFEVRLTFAWGGKNFSIRRRVSADRNRSG